MTPRWTTRMLCPFCRQDFPGYPPVLCGGNFLDRDHPSAVRPVLVDVKPDGQFADDTEQCLADARARYKNAR